MPIRACRIWVSKENLMEKEKSLSFVVSYEALEKNSLQAPTTDFTLDGGLTSFEQITTDITGKRLSKPPLTLLTTQPIDESQLEKLQLYKSIFENIFQNILILKMNFSRRMPKYMILNEDILH